MPALPEPPAARALLLQGLSGQGLLLQAMPPAPSDAPPARPILTATHLLLPALDAAQQRAAVAHAAAHLLYSTPRQPSATLKPLAQAVVAAVEDARVEQLLARSLPGVRAWFDAPLRAALQADGLSCEALLSRLDLALHDAHHPDGNHWVHKARTLFAATCARHGLEDARAFRRIAAVLANDLGQMRVRYDPQRFAVPAAYRDDHSYLWDHGRDRIEPAPGLAAPPADTAPAGDGDAVRPILAEHHYPEWDRRSGVLREDWCTLQEIAPASTAPATAASARRLALPARWRAASGRRLRRQRDGDELDLDAALEAAVLRRLGLAPPVHIFQRPGPDPAAPGLLLLLDASQSTAAVGANGRSLLSLEQEAALLLAQAVQAARGRMAIHAFCSDTRARVHYQRLLDFGAPLDAAARARLQALQPAWSTRLGTALRHACTLLASEPAGRRTLLVLSDGAPSDVDVYDPRHLVEDARAAVQAAARTGVSVYGLVVDPGAADDARRIFGAGRCRIAGTAGQLPRQLLALHARFAGP